jgi:hypothetical protein
MPSNPALSAFGSFEYPFGLQQGMPAELFGTKVPGSSLLQYAAPWEEWQTKQMQNSTLQAAQGERSQVRDLYNDQPGLTFEQAIPQIEQIFGEAGDVANLKSLNDVKGSQAKDIATYMEVLGKLPPEIAQDLYTRANLESIVGKIDDFKNIMRPTIVQTKGGGRDLQFPDGTRQVLVPAQEDKKKKEKFIIQKDPISGAITGKIREDDIPILPAGATLGGEEEQQDQSKPFMSWLADKFGGGSTQAPLKAAGPKINVQQVRRAR